MLMNFSCRFSQLLLVVFFFASQNTWAQKESKDLEWGEAGLAEFSESIGFYHDSTLEHVISRVGNKLVAALDNNPFTYEFYILDTEIPNAFALPGGKVLITRGFLFLINNEDELAGVLGHEIIHSHKRHATKSIGSEVAGSIVALPGIIISGILRGEIAESVANPFLKSGHFIIGQYSQKNETEADKLGVKLAAEAGYNPNALADVLDRLAIASNFFSGEEEEESYFSDHPYTPNRIETINKMAPAKIQNTLDTNFMAHLNGLVFSQNPSNGFVMDDWFYLPKALFKIKIPEAWDHVIFENYFVAYNMFTDEYVRISIDTTNKENFIADKVEEFRELFEQNEDMNVQFSWYGQESQRVVFSPEESQTKTEIIGLNTKHGKKIQVITQYHEKESQTISALKSMQPFKKADLPDYEIEVLKIVKATKNQTLKDLLPNAEPEILRYVQIINAKEADHKFDANATVKLIVKQFYRL